MAGNTKEVNGLIVDSGSFIDWALEPPLILEPMALKCSACKMVAMHTGFDMTIANLTDPKVEKHRRFVMCTNCGQTSTK